MIKRFIDALQNASWWLTDQFSTKQYRVEHGGVVDSTGAIFASLQYHETKRAAIGAATDEWFEHGGEVRVYEVGTSGRDRLVWYYPRSIIHKEREQA